MNKALFIILISLFLSNCGEDESIKPREKASELQCNKERNGVYIFEYELISGDCGELDSDISSFDVMFGFKECDIYYSNWSDNNCKHEEEVSCDFYYNYTHLSITAVSIQKDESADIITGTLTFDLDTISGTDLCSGTYKFTATRQ